tara:strand:+ start:87 stop:860 length:774 start_codon:yes stop_codon:yes gene_type:complete
MSYFKWTKDKNEKDNSYGVDLDKIHYDINFKKTQIPSEFKYGDYEILKKATVGVSGDNLIIPANEAIDIDDYITMDGRLYNKDLLSDDQKETLDIMEDRINNGRLSDIKLINENLLDKEKDIIINSNNNETSIKGQLEQNTLNNTFFSDINMKGLQDTIRYGVYKDTGEVIGEQSLNELYLVMRSIIYQYGNFMTNDIVNEIQRLNRKVLIYTIQNISSNVKQHMKYINELERLPIPLDRPAYTNESNYTYNISNLL